MARISINGELIDKIDLCTPVLSEMTLLFSRAGLSSSSHEINIKVDREKNRQSTGRKVAISAIELEGA